MKRAYFTVVSAVLVAGLVSALVAAQAMYQPKFKGDPAHSDSEAAALGYMRTLLRAQKIYKKKYGHYATTLLDLTKTGSFTRRMAATNRGDYTVVFKSHKETDKFEIALVPKQLDAGHRSFFSDEQGTIRGDEQKEADEGSPVLKAD
jgi:ketol-acid reductoisomerase